jgi:hypothetical protein
MAFEEIHGVEYQREASFEAGRGIGLMEAALCILDNPRFDARARYWAAVRIGVFRGASEFANILAPDPGDANESCEVTEEEVAQFRERLQRGIHYSFLAYCDHFTCA